MMFVVDLSGLGSDDKSSVESVLGAPGTAPALPPAWVDVVSKADLDKQPGALDMFREIVAQVIANTSKTKKMARIVATSRHLVLSMPFEFLS